MATRSIIKTIRVIASFFKWDHTNEIAFTTACINVSRISIECLNQDLLSQKYFFRLFKMEKKWEKSILKLYRHSINKVSLRYEKL